MTDHVAHRRRRIGMMALAGAIAVVLTSCSGSESAGTSTSSTAPQSTRPTPTSTSTTAEPRSTTTAVPAFSCPSGDELARLVIEAPASDDLHSVGQDDVRTVGTSECLGHWVVGAVGMPEQDASASYGGYWDAGRWTMLLGFDGDVCGLIADHETVEGAAQAQSWMGCGEEPVEDEGGIGEQVTLGPAGPIPCGDHPDVQRLVVAGVGPGDRLNFRFEPRPEAQLVGTATDGVEVNVIKGTTRTTGSSTWVMIELPSTSAEPAGGPAPNGCGWANARYLSEVDATGLRARADELVMACQQGLRLDGSQATAEERDALCRERDSAYGQLRTYGWCESGPPDHVWIRCTD